MIENGNDDIFAAIEYANAQVLAQQEQTMSKMKTTIAMAYIKVDETIIAHVGDSRVYAFKDGKVIFQTMDHSASQMAVAVGEITLDEIRNHEDRNRLTRVLGASDEIKIDAVSIQNDQYDALLICSDGFWEYVLEDEMEESLVSSDSAMNWLYKMRTIQANRAPENCDNNTAIVIRNVIE
jgi:serine/threonine protein phosphatase PrpC